MAASERKGLQNVTSLFSPLATEQRECEQHGAYTANKFQLPGGEARMMWSGCPACDRERVRLEDQAIREEAQEARRQAKLEQLIGRAAIPKRFLNRTLDNYRVEHDGQKKALASVRRYVDQFDQQLENGTSIIMCGHPGTGKTHLAVGVIQAVMAQGRTATYTRMLEIARAIKDTYDRESRRKERDVYTEFARPDLLVIDEIGHQHGSDTERLVLFEVINQRYEECKPTVLITNLALPQLKTYLDDRAADRLREGGGRVVVFDWQSQRGEI